MSQENLTDLNDEVLLKTIREMLAGTSETALDRLFLTLDNRQWLQNHIDELSLLDKAITKLWQAIKDFQSSLGDSQIDADQVEPNKEVKQIIERYRTEVMDSADELILLIKITKL